MATVKGFPPKIVLLRTGDQSNDFLYDVLISHVSDIHLLNESTEAGVLEIY
jgi:predicted nuclease of predicted toxin-antitoxin system